MDYQEGAGGEFFASWLSAHFGQTLVANTQENPNYCQKWLNSYSLINKGWNEQFFNFFQNFLSNCQDRGITQIAIPYHLYKWPNHVKIIRDCCPFVRFVRINCNRYKNEIAADFQRKVLLKKLGPADFGLIKFMLNHCTKEEVNHVLTLFKNQELVFGDLVTNSMQSTQLKNLPSQDIEINYQDFFVDFDNTAQEYQKLCAELNISPNNKLLTALIERNKKNWQDLQEHLSTL